MAETSAPITQLERLPLVLAVIVLQCPLMIEHAIAERNSDLQSDVILCKSCYNELRHGECRYWVKIRG